MKLGLGTVQFGLDYGISNTKGKVLVDEVARILNSATEAGFRLLDTAPTYGQSEKVLGQTSVGKHFNIVTKMPGFQTAKITSLQVEKTQKQFFNSLRNLKVKKVYGLMSHHVDNLLSPGGELLYQQMQEWKAEGVIRKIGASVYDQEQIERLLNKYKIDLIQLPVNILDQRLVASGCLSHLKSQDIEIHSRSVFLQGLLLVPPERLDAYFNPIKNLLTRFKERLTALGISPVAAALNYVKNIDEIDCCLVGVDSLKQFEQITIAYKQDIAEEIDYISFACKDKGMLNPSLWKL